MEAIIKILNYVNFQWQAKVDGLCLLWWTPKCSTTKILATNFGHVLYTSTLFFLVISIHFATMKWIDLHTDVKRIGFMACKVPHPLFVGKREVPTNFSWGEWSCLRTMTCRLTPLLGEPNEIHYEVRLEPILPSKGSLCIGYWLSGLSGVNTFSSILHPFGHQPLALLACTL